MLLLIQASSEGITCRAVTGTGTVADTAKDKHLPIVKGNLPNTDLGTEALWDAVAGFAFRVEIASLRAMA